MYHSNINNSRRSYSVYFNEESALATEIKENSLDFYETKEKYPLFFLFCLKKRMKFIC